MPLFWNEIKTRAAAFVSEWKDKAAAAGEKADDAEFMPGFLNIFGNEGRKKAIREYKVALGKNETGTSVVCFGLSADLFSRKNTPVSASVLPLVP